MSEFYLDGINASEVHCTEYQDTHCVSCIFFKSHIIYVIITWNTTVPERRFTHWVIKKKYKHVVRVLLCSQIENLNNKSNVLHLYDNYRKHSSTGETKGINDIKNVILMWFTYHLIKTKYKHIVSVLICSQIENLHNKLTVIMICLSTLYGL